MWYSYAIIRIVPRVERGEFINAGVILFSPTHDHLAAKIELDADRLRALAPEVDLEDVERHLQTFCDICAGKPEGGPLAELPTSERFHWLTAPRSTIIQTSPVHVGVTDDLDAALDELLTAFVRPPKDD